MQPYPFPDYKPKINLEYSLPKGLEQLSINSDTGVIKGKAPQVDSDTTYPVDVEVFDGKDKVIERFYFIVRNSE